MTEEIAATPGWVDERLDQVFASLPASAAVASARRSYADCLARDKAPAAPSDMLGAEFAECRPRLRAALLSAGMDHAALSKLDAALEALEAEVAGDS